MCIYIYVHTKGIKSYRFDKTDVREREYVCLYFKCADKGAFEPLHMKLHINNILTMKRTTSCIQELTLYAPFQVVYNNNACGFVQIRRILLKLR